MLTSRLLISKVHRKGLSGGAEQEAEASVKQVNEKLQKKVPRQGHVKQLDHYVKDMSNSAGCRATFSAPHRGPPFILGDT